MTDYVARGELNVAAELADFVEAELLAGTDIAPDAFWASFDSAVHRLAPRNRELLAIRASMQSQIDSWLRDNAASGIDSAAYTAFLREIGYLVEEGDDFSVETSHVDQEIASIAARSYSRSRRQGQRHCRSAASTTPRRHRRHPAEERLYRLDQAVAPRTPAPPFRKPGRRLWRPADLTGLSVSMAPLSRGSARQEAGCPPHGFAGHIGDAADPAAVVLRNHGLHVLVKIDRDGVIGCDDAAGINDVVAELAMSSIMDCEDPVAYVDAEDKVLAYRNWRGLMDGTLQERFEKGGAPSPASLPRTSPSPRQTAARPA